MGTYSMPITLYLRVTAEMSERNIRKNNIVIHGIPEPKTNNKEERIMLTRIPWGTS